jgi:hypothetical protein
MASITTRLADLWIGRYARPDPQAIAAVEGRKPAIVITGGSEGIGLALAKQLVGEAEHIVLVARREAPLAEAAELLRRSDGASVHTFVLDVARRDAPDAIANALAERGLYLDLLVNNAGIGQAGTFDTHDPDRLAELIDCNVRGLSLLMRSVLPEMLARARGGILNVASLGGMAPGPFQSAYYASKAYVISLTEAAAFEARGRGVRIAVLAPGPVATRFHARMGSEAARYRRFMPAADPDRVAASAVRWFAAGRRLIFPGILPNCLAVLMRFVPHALVMPVIGWLLEQGEGT